MMDSVSSSRPNNLCRTGEAAVGATTPDASARVSLLNRFARHKIAPQVLNYFAGMVTVAGLALVVASLLQYVSLILPGAGIAMLGIVLFVYCASVVAQQRSDDVHVSDAVDASLTSFIWGGMFVFSLPFMLLHAGVFYCLDTPILGTDFHRTQSGYVLWVAELPTKAEIDGDSGMSSALIA